ncbi:ribonucleotide reductase subunit 1 [Cyprinid herpesvirus 1]|uniref:Ribonucleoside-diphosphate reductase n=1 Tax=Cyprinid herpesvirus 1 TaxID=317858 RepID=K7PBY6_9VIRU|nr:ribonucleotide reductase subunit 1 [Cyprinid herpesvirus 1]AFJ20428.1 ribonucleotide reductase subunit 1 [Cyprinid herpesvirus 1]
MDSAMTVIKRDGSVVPVDIGKVAERVRKCEIDSVDCELLAQQVQAGIHNGCKTAEIDVLLAHTAASMTTKHPNYGLLAAKVSVSNLHLQTVPEFSKTCEKLWKNINPDLDVEAPLISDEIFKLSQEHAEELDAALIHGNDHTYSYFGFKTLERSYLLKGPKGPIERPQHMLMRCALQIHKHDIPSVLETYRLLSNKFMIHASPTLFNSGSSRPQLSSCFLLNLTDDSMAGIMETVRRCAMISKYAGGIGLSMSNLRASGSYIAGTNGQSNGLVPVLRIFNMVARLVDQGGKRPGAFAIYMEPWHADIFDFLDLRKNSGVDERRTRDLFTALWVPDLFMQRVRDDGDWSLMCPASCPGLDRVWGHEFNELYEQYEATPGAVRRVVKARYLWSQILVSQLETGSPYMLYKDSANAKSNHQNLGTIRCSNLCTEIMEYTDSQEVAVCNLASIALPEFVQDGGYVFNHEYLAHVTKVATRNLNKIIDCNFYPLEECSKSNLRHRPIGIGVQGLADVFQRMMMPFTSPEAKKLNREIFETIYYAALQASCELAKEHGPYSSYQGSPVSKGILQFDMWNVKDEDLSGRWDWAELRRLIGEHGVRNSLLVAPMPTASTAQILGNNESIEPYTSNFYQRRVLSGDFQIVNPHLVKCLETRGLWNEDMRLQLTIHRGSVQNIPGFPEDLKEIFKTVWELSQRDIIDMAADRAPFIDQSQSLNLHLGHEDDQNIKLKKLTAMHMHGWGKGLKTGMYYLRTKAAADPVQFTVMPSTKRPCPDDGEKRSRKSPKTTNIECTDDVCVMCSS